MLRCNEVTVIENEAKERKHARACIGECERRTERAVYTRRVCSKMGNN